MNRGNSKNFKPYSRPDDADCFQKTTVHEDLVNLQVIKTLLNKALTRIKVLKRNIALKDTKISYSSIPDSCNGLLNSTLAVNPLKEEIDSKKDLILEELKDKPGSSLFRVEASQKNHHESYTVEVCYSPEPLENLESPEKMCSRKRPTLQDPKPVEHEGDLELQSKELGKIRKMSDITKNVERQQVYSANSNIMSNSESLVKEENIKKLQPVINGDVNSSETSPEIHIIEQESDPDVLIVEVEQHSNQVYELIAEEDKQKNETTLKASTDPMSPTTVSLSQEVKVPQSPMSLKTNSASECEVLRYQETYDNPRSPGLDNRVGSQSFVQTDKEPFKGLKVKPISSLQACTMAEPEQKSEVNEAKVGTLLKLKPLSSLLESGTKNVNSSYYDSEETGEVYPSVVLETCNFNNPLRFSHLHSEYSQSEVLNFQKGNSKVPSAQELHYSNCFENEKSINKTVSKSNKTKKNKKKRMSNTDMGRMHFFKVCMFMSPKANVEAVSRLLKSVGIEEIADIVVTNKQFLSTAVVSFSDQDSFKKAISFNGKLKDNGVTVLVKAHNEEFKWPK